MPVPTPAPPACFLHGRFQPDESVVEQGGIAGKLPAHGQGRGALHAGPAEFDDVLPDVVLN